MLPAQRLLTEVIASLRQVIAPAVTDPYARNQAYMAAVILEFIARQVEERPAIATDKEHAVDSLFADLASSPAGGALLDLNEADPAARMGRAIERLYASRDELDADEFAALHQRLREALRLLLDAELSVAGPRLQ